MRVKIQGESSFDRILSVLKDLVARTPDGATISGLNIYLTLRDPEGMPIEFLGHDGNPLEIITYAEQTKQVPLHKKPPQKRKKPKLSVVPNKAAPAEPNTAQSAA